MTTKLKGTWRFKPNVGIFIGERIWLSVPWSRVGDPKDEELEATMRLVSAAPELLEAAEWCISLCEETGATYTNAYASAKAAIAKAKGETP